MLEKLFTSKARVRILEYLFFSKNETYLREISKELNLSPNAVKRELDKLNALGLIKKENGKITLDERSQILEELKNIFIKTESIAIPIKNSLKRVKADFIIIFGSFARGDYQSDSDVDLLIIGEAMQSEIFKILKPVEKIIRREINPIVWTVDELKKMKGKAIVKDILKKKKIMIFGDENEFRKFAE